MSDIKVGDLVMVVRPQPCCGKYGNYTGIPFKVKEMCLTTICGSCNRRHPAELSTLCPDGAIRLVSRLKKIDPPSHGDSLPTRKDMEITQ